MGCISDVIMDTILSPRLSKTLYWTIVEIKEITEEQECIIFIAMLGK